jgi:peptidyl-prolyl cis-trans isomerase SurA
MFTALAFGQKGRVPFRLAVLALALPLVAGACNRGAATPAATVTPSAETWAVVDGREIRREDVEKAYRRMADPAQRPSEEEALTAKLSLLNDLVVQDILLAKAQALKIEVPDTEIEAALTELRQGRPEEQFQQELARRQLTAAEMRDGVRKELLAQKVIEREAMSKAAVSDQDVTAFYEANRAQFNLAEDAYHIAQIVVTPGRDQQLANRTRDDATTAEAAARKAQMLMERLKQGAPFAELAADYSEDPQTAPRGGDLGFVPVSALRQAPPPLRDAVLKGEPGTVNGVTVGGVHTIVLLVAKETAGQRDLNTPGVRDRIQATLRDRRAQLLRTAYLSKVRNEASVVNHAAARVLETPAASPTLAPKAPGQP